MICSIITCSCAWHIVKTAGRSQSYQPCQLLSACLSYWLVATYKPAQFKLAQLKHHLWSIAQLLLKETVGIHIIVH